jgi:hypothetical protein
MEDLLMTMSIAFGLKAVNVRRDRRVALSFFDPTGSMMSGHYSAERRPWIPSAAKTASNPSVNCPVADEVAHLPGPPPPASR